MTYHRWFAAPKPTTQIPPLTTFRMSCQDKNDPKTLRMVNNKMPHFKCDQAFQAEAKMV
jgi:hypothetical protein